MDAERWKRIDAVVQEALAVEPARRAAVLDAHCGGDDDLRREAEALLAPAARTEGFLAGRALEDAASALAASGKDVNGTMRDEDDDGVPAALPAGTMLGPYELGASLGAGGMGEVYEARDTRLGRIVALKVLPRDLASDPERRRRFEHEARAASALNHPHICTLHDIGDAVPVYPDLPLPRRSRAAARSAESGGPVRVSYLVLERLTGQTLAERLTKGPLPVAHVLDLGAQIADALSAAHRAGIIHRDLKPGNVMLTKGPAGANGPSGLHATLLDFGLAKRLAHGKPPLTEPGGGDAAASASLTARGEVLGTWPYMAPEQVEGKPADARTDLWALGAVLYEMLTGRRAFEGDTPTKVAAAILEHEPAPVGTLQPDTPPALARLITKCLAKDPDDRWDTAHDVADELRWVARAPSAAVPTRVRPGVRWLLAIGSMGVVVAVVITVLASLLGSRRQVPEVRHFTIGIEPASGLFGGFVTPSPAVARIQLNRPNKTIIALTPDGRHLVFVGYDGKQSKLYIREVFAPERLARAVEGTGGADAPFLSPDGRWAGYWVNAKPPAVGTVLMKVSLFEEGPPAVICAIPDSPSGASWGDDDYIIFADSSTNTLWRVSSAGGSASQLISGSPEDLRLAHPHVLPGSRAVLFTSRRGPWNWEEARVKVYRRDSETVTEVVRGAADARYLATGHLICFRRGQLVAVGFDLDTLHTTGQERVLLADVMQATNGVNVAADSGDAQLAVSSASGTLAYVTGGQVPDVNRRPVWVDRLGRVEALNVEPKPYYAVRLSPDGQRAALFTLQSDRRVWVFELDRPDSLMAVTPAEVSGGAPVWSPDGELLAFGQINMASARMFTTRADGSQRQPDPLGPEGGTYTLMQPASWGRNGDLIYVTYGQAQLHDIWLLSDPRGAARSRPLVATRWREQLPQLSQDGGWLAWTSNESGANEVFVARLPSLTPRRKVAGPNAGSPVWARDGRTLFYVQLRGDGGYDLVARGIGPDGTPGVQDQRLFDRDSRRLLLNSPTPAFDVSLDAQRFLFLQDLDTPPPPYATQILLVEDWFEELRAMVPRR